MFGRSAAARSDVAALAALGIAILACGSGGSSSSGPSPDAGAASAGSQTVASKAPTPTTTPAIFSLGGAFKVDLQYAEFTYAEDCPATMKGSVQPFVVSYRATADGPNVTFKNLGQGFDMTGTGQPDGTLSLSGAMTLAPGLTQSGTLLGQWTPQKLDFAATIKFDVTPAQGPKMTCSVKSHATGAATPTT